MLFLNFPCFIPTSDCRGICLCQANRQNHCCCKNYCHREYDTFQIRAYVTSNCRHNSAPTASPTPNAALKNTSAPKLFAEIDNPAKTPANNVSGMIHHFLCPVRSEIYPITAEEIANANVIAPLI